MAKQISISLTNKDIEKFYNKVRMDNQSDCHIYTGCKDKDGYGLPRVGAKHIRAHRISWFLSYGKIPQGSLVLHRCDNPSCVNPDHLFLGTAKDNSIDMKNKNRSSYGERNNGVKLTEQQVLEIIHKAKAFGKHCNLATRLSKIYNVDSHTIRNIISKRSWKYLNAK